MRSTLLAMIGAILLVGCSFKQNVESAERGVASFHRQLDSGQFDAIYDQTSSDFKQITPAAAFKPILEAVHRKLGRFKSGKTVGWKDNVSTNGHFVTLSYEAAYERGAATEQFIFRIKDDRATLAGYHISSNALILG